MYKGETMSGWISQKSPGVETVVGSPLDFDTGLLTATPSIKHEMDMLVSDMNELGFPLAQCLTDNQVKTRPEAEKQFVQIHDTASLIHLQWERAMVLGAKAPKEAKSIYLTQEFAAARLFNTLTHNARILQEKHQFIDTNHIAQLKNAIRENVNIPGQSTYDLKPLVDATKQAAEERDHSSAWAWTVLPTFPMQHYGRIVLGKVETRDPRYPAFIMQPTFKDGKAPQFHTHGQNWAIVTPLGPTASHKNQHINTLWEPNRRDNAFPLKQIPHGKVQYDTGDIIAIPPRVIHTISRLRSDETVPLSLQELKRLSDATVRDIIAQNRFGERSSLHVYFPDPRVKDSLDTSLWLQHDPRFFIENDMIVFDHFTDPPSIWAAGAGVWSRRMVEFGPTGQHCGICYQEDDPRRENLDPTTVYDWLISHPPLQAQIYSRADS